MVRIECEAREGGFHGEPLLQGADVHSALEISQFIGEAIGKSEFLPGGKAVEPFLEPADGYRHNAFPLDRSGRAGHGPSWMPDANSAERYQVVIMAMVTMCKVSATVRGRGLRP
ncbi:hypothetical protein GCM10010324_19150 [Streptomyces hiroshimensis]|uniref:Uncharacterized protein n=1 Tax=Streptomyces hiroshimensis TaxID=66424 RepID=A0ABQ2Y8T4_9ACTN|nr:hypothetical protein GCM10010324_19150 [Streptomyces hiroshimensis]